LKRVPVRLAVALAAFALNLVLVASRTNPTPTHAPCEQSASASAPAVNSEAPKQVSTKTPPVNREATEAKPVRVGQQEVVSFPGVGRVRVTAYEVDGLEAQLVFEKADTGDKLIDLHMGNEASGMLLRFRVMHVKGLPDPLVVGVSLTPGGSDSGWEAAAFGAVGGELKRLTRNEAFQSGDRGGFYFGDLGGGRGVGAAVWDFVWDSDYEGRPSAHRYEIKLCKWNGREARFEWERVLRTPGKFYSYKPALRSVGLRFKDIRRGMPGFDYLEEEYGP
jgi:hypothetical protein